MFRFMIKFEIGRRIDFKKDSHKNRKDLKKSKKVNKEKIRNKKNKKFKKFFRNIGKKLRLFKEEKFNLIKIQEIKESTKEERQEEKSHKGIEPLDPLTIPKYTNQLTKPPMYKPYPMKYCEVKNGRRYKKIKHFYRIDIGETYAQMLPHGYPKTKVYGYGGLVVSPRTGRTRYMMSSPGATFEARKGIPIEVKWVNKLRGRHMFPVLQ